MPGEERDGGFCDPPLMRFAIGPVSRDFVSVPVKVSFDVPMSQVAWKAGHRRWRPARSANRSE